MRRSSSARLSGVIGDGLNISLLDLFQQYLNLLLGLLQSLLAMTGQRNTAFEITQRLFQAEHAMLHFLDERLERFERGFEGKCGWFLGLETAPVESRHVSAPPLHGQCGACWKRRGRAANLSLPIDRYHVELPVPPHTPRAATIDYHGTDRR